MKKIIIFSTIFFTHLLTPVASAQQIQEDFYTAKISKIIEEGAKDFAGFPQEFQLVEVEILEGPKEGEKIEIQHGGDFSLTETQKVKLGDKIILAERKDGFSDFYIADKYRLNSLIWIGIGFLFLAVLFGGIKGFGSFVGLIFSIFILAKFIVPQIVEGDNPFLVSLLGTGIIAVISFYLAHGFRKRTTIALISTLITIAIAALMSVVLVPLTNLFGTGDEYSFLIQLNSGTLNLQGLLLGGIILGTLGVLDDITISQAAIVDELKRANKKLKFRDLYKHSISVGKDHIASLINTLVLAYAGASLPLFVLFGMTDHQPAWVILNGEAVAEEIVRTLIGSACLILAVPITTLMAAHFLSGKGKSEDDMHTHACVH